MLEKLFRDKHSRLLQTLVNYGHKKFYSIGPSSGGTVVDHLPAHSMVEGLSPATAVKQWQYSSHYELFGVKRDKTK